MFFSTDYTKWNTMRKTVYSDTTSRNQSFQKISLEYERRQDQMSSEDFIEFNFNTFRNSDTPMRWAIYHAEHEHL